MKPDEIIAEYKRRMEGRTPDMSGHVVADIVRECGQKREVVVQAVMDHLTEAG